MVHTLPDYTTKYKMTKIFGNIDDAELAARLGSINTFDRRGNVVWMDDFEAATLKWVSTTIGGLGSGALSTDTARNGASCFKMVTDNVTGRGWQILKRLPIPESGRLGIEFSMSSAVDKWRISVDFVLYTLAGTIRASYTWDEDSDRLWIIPSSGVSTDIFTDAEHTQDIHLFNTMKLVVDIDNLKFVRALWNDVEIDLSNYALRQTGYTAAYFLGVNINVHARENVAKTVYVDDVIITQNEL